MNTVPQHGGVLARAQPREGELRVVYHGTRSMVGLVRCRWGVCADGVQTCHMFMLRAETPMDLAVILLHHLVRDPWIGRTHCF